MTPRIERGVWLLSDRRSINWLTMWSIGIYSGESIFQMAPPSGLSNPILTSQEIHCVSAEFVADPFMIRARNVWYMFFEVLNAETRKGEIGLATSRNGFDWTWRQIVLAEAFHLSYPYVFEWEGDYYMIPETLQAGSVSLYKAEPFPGRWSRVGSLMEGRYADPSIFYFNDRWWMFVCSTPYKHDTLRLYFAEELMGPWREHPDSPIVESNNRIARPAGRVVILDDRIIRFSQDCVPNYGARVRAFEISELTTSSYGEAEHESSPVLSGSGNGWNALGMHHIDPHPVPGGGWIACVDGLSIGDTKPCVC